MLIYSNIQTHKAFKKMEEQGVTIEIINNEVVRHSRRKGYRDQIWRDNQYVQKI